MLLRSVSLAFNQLTATCNFQHGRTFIHKLNEYTLEFWIVDAKYPLLAYCYLVFWMIGYLARTNKDSQMTPSDAMRPGPPSEKGSCDCRQHRPALQISLQQTASTRPVGIHQRAYVLRCVT